MAPPTVVALFGPTGVGKTAVAIALAERLRAHGEDPVAVSADALQVYRGLERLTGAATAEERERLEHRLIGVLPVSQTFSAGAYARLAHREIDALLAAGRRPIVVGGTGLYLRAALAELDLRPPVPPAVRERRRADLERRGVAALHAELAARAPAAAAAIRPTDTHRLLRALELLDAGHPPPVVPPEPGDVGAAPPVAASKPGDVGAAPPAPAPEPRAAGPAPPPPAARLWTADTRHPTLLAGLTMDREVLRARIDERVEAIVAAGAAAEVRAAAPRASATARQAVGFRELLDGDVEAVKAATRRYAKRQLTWMRKLGGVLLLDVTAREPAAVAAELHAALAAREA